MQEPHEVPLENNAPLDEQSIIDRFLSIAPKMPKPMPETQDEARLGETGDVREYDQPLDPTLAEALAKALVAQGKRKQAATILLKLAAQKPEKSAYFADLLDNRAPSLDIF